MDKGRCAGMRREEEVRQTVACGVWVAMVTPWDETSGSPRMETISRLVERFCSAGIAGLFILGTTGEGTLLSPENRMRFAECVVEVSRGKLPVIVHTGHDQTAAAIALSQHAREIGAFGVAVAPPARYPLDHYELACHYLRIAKEVGDYPVFLSDIPDTTGNPLGAPLLVELRKQAPNVIGAKVSRTDWESWEDYLKLSSEVALLVGKDEMALPLLLMGAHGLVSSGANVLPKLYVALYRAAIRRDLETGVQLQQLVSQLCRICHQGRSIAFIKNALSTMGFDVGLPLAPLRRLSPEESAEFAAALGPLMATVSDAMTVERR